mmetsp:Transcript_37733/g.87167  ORF Transcript_37733/g.87167 Transcript_37733/m.87167 type:complete len:186 (-) Transcript_37733:143-700(-)
MGGGSVQTHDLVEAKEDPVDVSCGTFLEAVLQSQSTTRAAQHVDGLGSYDLDSLLAYLDKLKAGGNHFTEVTYVVNKWTLAGFIPFEHHGFIFQTSEKDLAFLSVDFGMRGILWDVYDQFPEVPDGTYHVEAFPGPVDPLKLRTYCAESEPFNYFGNDCATWSKYLREELNMSPGKGVMKPIAVS